MMIEINSWLLLREWGNQVQFSKDQYLLVQPRYLWSREVKEENQQPSR